jgi:hypothetical protein
MIPNEPQTLEARVDHRKRQLIAELTMLKHDVKDGAAEARDKIKARLSQLAHIVKSGVVDGWANVDAAVTTRLDRWITE